jgi:hypothetical protein
MTWIFNSIVIKLNIVEKVVGYFNILNLQVFKKYENSIPKPKWSHTCGKELRNKKETKIKKKNIKLMCKIVVCLYVCHKPEMTLLLSSRHGHSYHRVK